MGQYVIDLIILHQVILAGINAKVYYLFQIFDQYFIFWKPFFLLQSPSHPPGLIFSPFRKADKQSWVFWFLLINIRVTYFFDSFSYHLFKWQEVVVAKKVEKIKKLIYIFVFYYTMFFTVLIVVCLIFPSKNCKYKWFTVSNTSNRNLALQSSWPPPCLCFVLIYLDR